MFALAFGLWIPVSLVFWWRNMADYSRPYEVGLIDAGTSLRKADSFGLK